MTSLPVLVDIPERGEGPLPLTFGVPFPRGELGHHENLRLVDPTGAELPIQTRPTAMWPDGSVRWVLVDTLLPGTLPTTEPPKLMWDQAAPRQQPPMPIERVETFLRIDAGVAHFGLPGASGMALDRIGIEAPCAGTLEIQLCDRERSYQALVSEVDIAESGPVRTGTRIRGEFGDSRITFTARFQFFASTALMRLDLTIENRRRARHRRGVWDLGDGGSLHFRDLSVSFRPTARGGSVHWSENADQPTRSCSESLRIHQESSGGINWRSSNHRDAGGNIPMKHRGYVVSADNEPREGLRAQPIVGLSGHGRGVAAHLRGFWQNFPTGFEADEDRIRAQLFAPPTVGHFELQGGEQKTHTIWFDFDADWNGAVAPLTWARPAPSARVPAGWYARAGVDPTLDAERIHPLIEEIVRGAARGPNNLAERREIIDEYGWRNFGDIFADHEARYHQGPEPMISHYNNQYDVLYGSLLHYLWSGDRAWYEIASPLARHIVDIDLYNTDEDRPNYNGGLFWHTDHYLDAASSTHRSYSAANRHSRFASYGGGPSSENNYATGLLLHHFLTGDPRSREAVIQLANWVMAMDDGTQNILGLIDPGPTGWATRTYENHYHGPGRGAGNSLYTMIDGWLLEGEQRYLDKADEIIRRTVHPEDEIEDHDLRNIERRWSYIIFLRSLDRYLTVKQQHDQIDEHYEYARRCMLHYGRWMQRHETPYFDRRDELEYPTEAWPALDILKANNLRAAANCAAPSEAAEMARTADELIARATEDLSEIKTRDSARAVSHCLRESLRDGHWHRTGIQTRPIANQERTPPRRQSFVPQRAIVVQKLCHPRHWPTILRRLMSPRVWRKVRLRRP